MKDLNCSGIYGIINTINNKIYIGSAVNIKIRWQKHKSALKFNKHYNSYLQNSWNKYGKHIFEFFVIEYVKNKDKLIEREQYYMDMTLCFNSVAGYNSYPVAGSPTNRHITKETKNKISNSLKNYFKTEKGIQQADIHKEFLEDYYKTHNGYFKGKKLSEETKLKIGEANKKYIKPCGKDSHMYGKKQSKELIEKRIKNLKIPVCQINKHNLELVNIFDSFKEAKQVTGIKVREAAHGFSKSAGNFYWCKLSDWQHNQNEIINLFISYRQPKKVPSLCKKIAQIDLNTDKIIRIFSSTVEAQKITGINGISACARGRYKRAKNYKWRYINKKGEIIEPAC